MHLHRSKLTLRIFIVAGTACFGIVSAGYWGGLRLNLTPSYPLGLWRILPLARPVSIGDRVFICLPRNTAAFAMARERGYLPGGLCDGNVAPLIKTIVATGGQSITIRNLVAVDGKPVPSSSVRSLDGEGRPLAAFVGGVVPEGAVFLHSDFAGSYDSRYFGPTTAKGILGLAQPILTVSP